MGPAGGGWSCWPSGRTSGSRRCSSSASGFTWPLAEQPPHALLTTGPYRLVRHPSYAGALVGAFGWALLFRSAPAFGLIALLFPFFVPVIAAEEATLVDEFGDAYRDYRRRTWRLIPFVY